MLVLRFFDFTLLLLELRVNLSKFCRCLGLEVQFLVLGCERSGSLEFVSVDLMEACSS